MVPPSESGVLLSKLSQAALDLLPAAALRALRRTEERLTLALSAGRLGSWEFDLTTGALTASPQCKANHGLGPDAELRLDDIVLTIDSEYQEQFRSALDRAIETGGAFEIEVRHRWPDGSHHWLFVAGRVSDSTCVVGVSADITERREIEEALRVSEQRYKVIVETANEGIWMLDEHARITFVNPRMTELTGYTPTEMIGRYKWDFVFPEDVNDVKGLFDRRRTGLAEDLMDIRFRHRNGHEVWTLLSARPTYDNAGHFVGAIDLFTDITERRRAEQAAIAADRTKDEFLAVLSHELRNPIAPILTAVRLLQLKGPQDPALQKLRATIERQTEHLSRLIGDLMDVGAIMSGKLHLDRHPADLNAILKQAVETTIPLIERRKHTLRVIASESPIYVDVDAARIVQVVVNILNNAAKYMQEGGVIEVIATFREGSGVVRIRDQGVGIAPEMLDRIFQKYVQVDSSRHRAQGGLGIGLALVKAIVELHGGSVEAHSEGIGRGSEFVVRLPVVSVEAVST